MLLESAYVAERRGKLDIALISVMRDGQTEKGWMVAGCIPVPSVVGTDAPGAAVALWVEYVRFP